MEDILRSRLGLRGAWMKSESSKAGMVKEDVIKVKGYQVIRECSEWFEENRQV